MNYSHGQFGGLLHLISFVLKKKKCFSVTASGPVQVLDVIGCGPTAAPASDIFTTTICI